MGSFTAQLSAPKVCTGVRHCCSKENEYSPVVFSTSHVTASVYDLNLRLEFTTHHRSSILT